MNYDNNNYQQNQQYSGTTDYSNDPNQTSAFGNNQQPRDNTANPQGSISVDAQQYRQFQQWQQQYQQGNHDQVPHDQLHRHWNQYAQQADPQQVQQAAAQGYQQVPTQQRPGIADSLLNFFKEHGLSPQAAGVQNTNPQNMTPDDMARMTQYAQQEKPDALKQLFQPGGTLSNPLIGMALAGALAFGISRMGKR